MHLFLPAFLFPQRSTFRRGGHQPPPVEPELWDDPTGLPGGKGRAGLLGGVGPDRGDGSNLPSSATPQSHVPEQLGRPPQPRKQGTLSLSFQCVCIYIYIYTYTVHVQPSYFVFVLQVLDIVSLPSDLPVLSTAAWLSTVERRRVTAIARLLNQLLTESSAVITSADTLLTELFSHRGETADSPRCLSYIYMRGGASYFEVSSESALEHIYIYICVCGDEHQYV